MTTHYEYNGLPQAVQEQRINGFRSLVEELPEEIQAAFDELRDILVEQFMTSSKPPLRATAARYADAVLAALVWGKWLI